MFNSGQLDYFATIIERHPDYFQKVTGLELYIPVALTLLAFSAALLISVFLFRSVRPRLEISKLLSATYLGTCAITLSLFHGCSGGAGGPALTQFGDPERVPIPQQSMVYSRLQGESDFEMNFGFLNSVEGPYFGHASFVNVDGTSACSTARVMAPKSLAEWNESTKTLKVTSASAKVPAPFCVLIVGKREDGSKAAVSVHIQHYGKLAESLSRLLKTSSQMTIPQALQALQDELPSGISASYEAVPGASGTYALKLMKNDQAFGSATYFTRASSSQQSDVQFLDNYMAGLGQDEIVSQPPEQPASFSPLARHALQLWVADFAAGEFQIGQIEEFADGNFDDLPDSERFYPDDFNRLGALGATKALNLVGFDVNRRRMSQIFQWAFLSAGRPDAYPGLQADLNKPPRVTKHPVDPITPLLAQLPIFKGADAKKGQGQDARYGRGLLYNSGAITDMAISQPESILHVCDPADPNAQCAVGNQAQILTEFYEAGLKEGLAIGSAYLQGPVLATRRNRIPITTSSTPAEGFHAGFVSFGATPFKQATETGIDDATTDIDTDLIDSISVPAGGSIGTGSGDGGSGGSGSSGYQTPTGIDRVTEQNLYMGIMHFRDVQTAAAQVEFFKAKLATLMAAPDPKKEPKWLDAIRKYTGHVGAPYVREGQSKYGLGVELPNGSNACDSYAQVSNYDEARSPEVPGRLKFGLTNLVQCLAYLDGARRPPPPGTPPPPPEGAKLRPQGNMFSFMRDPSQFVFFRAEPEGATVYINIVSELAWRLTEGSQQRNYKIRMNPWSAVMILWMMERNPDIFNPAKSIAATFTDPKLDAFSETRYLHPRFLNSDISTIWSRSDQGLNIGWEPGEYFQQIEIARLALHLEAPASSHRVEPALYEKPEELSREVLDRPYDYQQLGAYSRRIPSEDEKQKFLLGLEDDWEFNKFVYQRQSGGEYIGKVERKVLKTLECSWRELNKHWNDDGSFNSNNFTEVGYRPQFYDANANVVGCGWNNLGYNYPDAPEVCVAYCVDTDPFPQCINPPEELKTVVIVPGHGCSRNCDHEEYPGRFESRSIVYRGSSTCEWNNPQIQASLNSDFPNRPRMQIPDGDDDFVPPPNACPGTAAWDDWPPKADLPLRSIENVPCEWTFDVGNPPNGFLGDPAEWQEISNSPHTQPSAFTLDFVQAPRTSSGGPLVFSKEQVNKCSWIGCGPPNMQAPHQSQGGLYPTGTVRLGLWVPRDTNPICSEVCQYATAENLYEPAVFPWEIVLGISTEMPEYVSFKPREVWEIRERQLEEQSNNPRSFRLLRDFLRLHLQAMQNLPNVYVFNRMDEDFELPRADRSRFYGSHPHIRPRQQLQPLSSDGFNPVSPEILKMVHASGTPELGRRDLDAVQTYRSNTMAARPEYYYMFLGEDVYIRRDLDENIQTKFQWRDGIPEIRYLEGLAWVFRKDVSAAYILDGGFGVNEVIDRPPVNPGNDPLTGSDPIRSAHLWEPDFSEGEGGNLVPKNEVKSLFSVTLNNPVLQASLPPGQSLPPDERPYCERVESAAEGRELSGPFYSACVDIHEPNSDKITQNTRKFFEMPLASMPRAISVLRPEPDAHPDGFTKSREVFDFLTALRINTSEPQPRSQYEYARYCACPPSLCQQCEGNQEWNSFANPPQCMCHPTTQHPRDRMCVCNNNKMTDVAWSNPQEQTGCVCDSSRGFRGDGSGDCICGEGMTEDVGQDGRPECFCPEGQIRYGISCSGGGSGGSGSGGSGSGGSGSGGGGGNGGGGGDGGGPGGWNPDDPCGGGPIACDPCANRGLPGFAGSGTYGNCCGVRTTATIVATATAQSTGLEFAGATEHQNVLYSNQVGQRSVVIQSTLGMQFNRPDLDVAWKAVVMRSNSARMPTLYEMHLALQHAPWVEFSENMDGVFTFDAIAMEGVHHTYHRVVAVTLNVFGVPTPVYRAAISRALVIDVQTPAAVHNPEHWRPQFKFIRTFQSEIYSNDGFDSRFQYSFRGPVEYNGDLNDPNFLAALDCSQDSFGLSGSLPWVPSSNWRRTHLIQEYPIAPVEGAWAYRACAVARDLAGNALSTPTVSPIVVVSPDGCIRPEIACSECDDPQFPVCNYGNWYLSLLRQLGYPEYGITHLCDPSLQCCAGIGGQGYSGPFNMDTCGFTWNQGWYEMICRGNPNCGRPCDDTLNPSFFIDIEQRIHLPEWCGGDGSEGFICIPTEDCRAGICVPPPPPPSYWENLEQNDPCHGVTCSNGSRPVVNGGVCECASCDSNGENSDSCPAGSCRMQGSNGSGCCMPCPPGTPPELCSDGQTPGQCYMPDDPGNCLGGACQRCRVGEDPIFCGPGYECQVPSVPDVHPSCGFFHQCEDCGNGFCRPVCSTNEDCPSSGGSSGFSGLTSGDGRAIGQSSSGSSCGRGSYCSNGFCYQSPYMPCVEHNVIQVPGGSFGQ